jgi:hypothetical protein
MGTWVHELLSAPQATLYAFAVLIVAIAFSAPRLLPLVRVIRGGPAAAIAAPSEMPGSWLDKIRQEARHAAGGAVGVYVGKLSLLERGYDELKDELSQVRRTVEEMRPLAVAVAKATTAIDYMRSEQSEMRQEQREAREELSDGLREIRASILREAR